METLRDYRDRFKGQIVTMVGGAVTTVDYRDLVINGTETTILINWALRIAPLWRGSTRRRYFFTWHLDQFGHLPELLIPGVIPCVYHGGLGYLPPQLHDKAVMYTGVNVRPFAAYTHLLRDFAIHGQDYLDETGDIPSCANSTLLALMFVWHAGCRQINAVGMHDIGGVPRGHYDPRLPATNLPCPTPVYVRDLETFCGIMGIRVNYIGQR
mgnify:CR=1 FL=1